MRFIIHIFISVFLAVFPVNGQTLPEQLNIPLHTGDLLFCNATSGELSKAIDQATQTGNETHYDHVGIVEVRNDTVWVLHAAPKRGVCREPIGRFLVADMKLHVVTVYRLKPGYAGSIDAAIAKARAGIGQPYKFSYRMSDPGFYCSEYIYLIFSGDSIFKLNPMTFKDPQSGQLLPGWKEHYNKLGIPVPEGEPGCNPNGLAASEKLENLGMLTIMK